MKRGHIHATAVALAVIGVVLAFALGAFEGPKVKTIFGTRLNATGQKVYEHVASHKLEAGEENESLPATLAAKVRAANAKVVAQLGDHPTPLATPEPKVVTSYVKNYSARVAGARPLLLVVHDTESPNAAGLADVQAIRAWFNNPASQASSNYTTDADGNTIAMVPDTAKAWTQAAFNSYAISDEMIGYASQKSWPTSQLLEVANIFAHEAAKWGIPIRLGAVSGCTVTRAGIVDHLMLGACGGGHHDNGPDFPMARFIALVSQYADSLKPRIPSPKPLPKPAPSPKPKPVPKPAKIVVPSVTLKIGSRGAAVVALQRSLNAHGAKLKTDGVFGSSTRTAVVAFQRKRKLAADGVVGPATRKALNA